jgi:hypothetical protein
MIQRQMVNVKYCVALIEPPVKVLGRFSNVGAWLLPGSGSARPAVYHQCHPYSGGNNGTASSASGHDIETVSNHEGEPLGINRKPTV